MLDPEKPYRAITITFFIALIISVFAFSDLVAVIVIVGSVAGLALNWLSNQYGLHEEGWQRERERWEEGERWW